MSDVGIARVNYWDLDYSQENRSRVRVRSGINANNNRAVGSVEANTHDVQENSVEFLDLFSPQTIDSVRTDSNILQNTLSVTGELAEALLQSYRWA